MPIKAQRQLQTLSKLMAFAALLIGMIGIMGWVLDVDSFKNFMIGKATMKSNTAVLLILSSGLLIIKYKSSEFIWITRTFSLFILGVSLSVVIQHILQVKFGIDEILFAVKTADNISAVPGRMTLLASGCFVMLSISIFATSLNLHKISQTLSVLIIVSMYSVILGYMFKIDEYYNFGTYSSISFPTALALFCLGVSSLCKIPFGGFMKILIGEKVSSLVLRYIYGYGFLSVLFMIALYLYLINQQSFLPEVGIIFILIIALAASFPQVLFVLNKINKLENERLLLHKELEATNTALTDSNNQLQTIIEEYTSSNEILSITTNQLHDSNKALMESNQKLEKLHNELTQIVVDRTADLEYTLVELQERNQELDQYVYKVSHDIRSPIASISGVLNLIKLEKPPSKIKEYLDMVENRIYKLDGFIKSVLAHSKSLNSPCVLECIDFESIINQSWEEFHYDKDWHQVKLRKHLPKSYLFISDLVRLEIIFKNLFSNAIRYRNPLAKSYIDIEVSVSDCDSIIKVSDNGLGISEEHLENIFKMFYRGSRKSEGSGLGLYIVKQVIDRMEGSITISSKVNEGTLFTITLPNCKAN